MNRQNRYASSQEQARRQSFARNPAVPTNSGHILSDGNSVSMHMRRVAVEEARRKMQMKYEKEAEEAAEKRKQREQKKREARLARQEALVRPGHVLGTGRRAEQNLLRDYEEDQQDVNETEEGWLFQYNALQQGTEREKEAAPSQRRQEQRKDMKLTGQRDVRAGIVSGSAALGSSSRYSLRNRTSDYFLGTGYSATQASSDSNGRANRATVENRDHVFGAGSIATTPRSESYGFATQSSVAKSGHVLGGGNTGASPRSGSYGFANQGAAVSSGHVTGTVSAASGGCVLGMNSAATSSSCGNNYERDVQAHQRKEMLESRRRLQEQYDVHVRQAAEAKKQEEEDIVEKLEHTSLK